MWRKKFLGLIFLAAGLTACTVPPTPSPVVLSPTRTPTHAVTPTSTLTRAPTDTPTPPSPPFIFGAASDPVCLDPAVATDPVATRVTNQIFEGLVKFDRDTTHVLSGLAERWSVSDDGKAWTFMLRQGVQFHDGANFNADAVVKNFEYWKNSRHPQHVAQVRGGHAFDYFETFFDGFDGQSNLLRVEAMDPYTVRLILREPQASLLNALAVSAFAMASPRLLERTAVNLCTTPVGTGPYKFVVWKPGEQIALEAFANYWDKSNLARTPRVLIRTIPDDVERALALADGQVHAIEKIDATQIASVQADSRFKLIWRPANATAYLAFNFKYKEFQDVRVRQAFARAFDKTVLVAKTLGGLGLVAKQLQPPTLWGHNRDLEDWKYDALAAKKLLSEAGFPNGISDVTLDGKKVPLELWYPPVARPYLPNPQDTALALAADLAQVGIIVQPRTTEWATYLERRSVGALPLYILGWSSDNGDPDNMLCHMFCLDNRDVPLAREGFFNDKLLSDALKRAATINDRAQRARVYQQVEKQIRDQAWRVFLAHTQTPIVLQATVEGYGVNAMGGETWNTIVLK